MSYNDATPSLAQAIKMKKFMQDGKLTDEVIQSIMQEEKRKAILLYYFEGMNDTEIAELFNTSRSTIQYRRTSSFEKLRKYLEENADEWDEW